MIKEKSLLNYCGLLGVAAFLSYTAAVVFSPIAYPGYDWMAQVVSDIASLMEPTKQSVHLYSGVCNDGMRRHSG